MYHCHIHFYLAGEKCRVFEIIKEMAPLEHFTHEFSESDSLDESFVSKANVIIANLQNMDAKEAVRLLISGSQKKTELILLANKEHILSLADDLSKIKDIWTLPMSDEEIRFRLLRWQQAYKMGTDFWQTSHYLEATINNMPNLIWYKDKDGIHKKVNDSFCKTVHKTKEQVEGRGHAYIWDVEFDDPVCIESELEVMNSQQTRISEETIQTGEGLRQLTTYKSPLYDMDGSGLGTVGIGIYVTKERAYEQEILKKNETLEKIFTTIDCGVMRHTIDGKILSINRAALKILGYETQDELVKDGFYLIAPSVIEEDKARLKETIQALQQEDDTVNIEYRVQHKNGDILHIMGNVKLLKENGRLVYQRFLLDCTAQKLKEKKKEQRQRELIQALSIDYNLVCFFDLDTGKGFQFQSNDIDGYMFDSFFNGNISLE